MSTIVYRNLLIVERASPHNLFLKSMNIDFDDEDKPFKYSNPYDKVIFYFEIPLKDNDEIITLPGDYDLNNFIKNNWRGLIKIYSDRTQLKIHHLRSEDLNTFKLCLIVFNQYLIRNIYNLVPEKDINDTNFAIYWDNNILIEEYRNIAKHVKIYSNDAKNDNRHIFKVDNIKEFVDNIETIKNTNPQQTFTFNNSSSIPFNNQPTTNTPTLFTNPSTSFNPPSAINTPTLFTNPSASFNPPSAINTPTLFTNPSTSFNPPTLFAAPGTFNPLPTINTSTIFTSPSTSFNNAQQTVTTPATITPSTLFNFKPTTPSSFNSNNTVANTQSNLFGFKTNTGFKSSFGGFPSNFNIDKK